jgi:hypothetical protein
MDKIRDFDVETGLVWRQDLGFLDLKGAYPVVSSILLEPRRNFPSKDFMYGEKMVACSRAGNNSLLQVGGANPLSGGVGPFKSAT